MKNKFFGCAVAAATAAGGLYGASVSGVAIVAIPLLYSTSFLSGCMGAVAVGGRFGWIPVVAVDLGILCYLEYGPFARISGDAGMGAALVGGTLMLAAGAGVVGAIVGSIFGKRVGAA